MNIDLFLNRYVTCALWSSADDSGEPLEDNFSAGDIEPATLASMREDCTRFIAENADDLEAYDDEMDSARWPGAERAGHDFWLTRNRHGAGFWDRGLGALGDRLTDAAHAFGEVYLYVNDDGEVTA